MDYLDSGRGNLTESLRYYRENRHHLDTIIAAEVTFPGLSDHYPYCLQLRDDHGNRMFLSGVAAGYPGDAPRAAMEVLIDAGFPVSDAQRVMYDRQVVIRQVMWPPKAALLAGQSVHRERPDWRADRIR